MLVLFPFFPAVAALAGTLLLDFTTDGFPATPTAAPTSTRTYDFGNGSVMIDTPMQFRGRTLVEPKLLGAGGGGSVWSMTETADRKGSGPQNHDVVVKISWDRSADSVRNECDVLDVMERRGVTGVERCLGRIQYQYDPRRVVIAMEPLVAEASGSEGGDVTSSLAELSPSLRRRSALQLGRTMAQMLAANVVTTDVQPLISRATGEVTLIDMTEATVLTPGRGAADADRALIDAFCTELLGLIPDSLVEEATAALLQEVQRIETDTHVELDAVIKEVLRERYE